MPQEVVDGVRVSEKAPENTFLVRLPLIERVEGLVRLSIHTDAMQSLMRGFHRADVPSDLHIEGRRGTDAQFERSFFTSHL